MKKYFFPFIIAAVIGLFLFTSISKFTNVALSEPPEEMDQTELQKIFLAENISDCASIYLKDIQTLGPIHNQAVIDHYYAIRKKYDLSSCGDCLDKLRDYLSSTSLGIDFAALKVTKSEFVDRFVKNVAFIESIDRDISKWKNHTFSEVTYDYLLRMNSMIRNAEYYEDLSANLLKLQNEAITKIEDCNDFRIVVMTLEIARYSCSLWAPRKGEGKGDEPPSKGGEPDEPGDGDGDGDDDDGDDNDPWADALAADITAAATISLRVGVVGAVWGSTPALNTPFWSGVGVTIGIASAWGGLVGAGGSGDESIPPEPR